MTVDIAALGIAIDTTDVAKATTEMGKFVTAGDKMAASQNALQRSTKQMADGVKEHVRAQQEWTTANTAASASILREAEAADAYVAKIKRMADETGKTKFEIMRMNAELHGASDAVGPAIDQMETF